jgi:O-antigen/teichoic acid export membrane protein
LNNIRVTYSGLIALMVSLIGVVTGLIFVILITRTLTPAEFGLWTLLGSVVSYVLVIDPIVTYWSTRQVARGENIGKSSVSVAGLFSMIGLLVYFLIGSYLSDSLESNFMIFAVASLLIPVMFLNSNLSALCLGKKPQAISYGLIVFETTKIPLAFLFVIGFELGIIGVLAAIVGANLFKFIILFIFAREQLRGSIQRSMLKFWFRLSWLTLFQSSSGLIYKLDVLIFSLLTNSLIGLAYWGVSQTASSLITHSQTMSQGLYPKLLSGGKKEIFEKNFQQLMYFSIPFLCASIIFAKPLLHILNPIYTDGIYIVIFVALRSFTDIIRALFFSLISAYDTVDVDKQASIKLYFKSKLFFLPTLIYILCCSYIAILTIFLLFFRTPEMDDIFLVTVWGIIALVVTIPFAIYGYLISKKLYNISLPYIPILKYLAAASISSVVIYFISLDFLTYPNQILQFIPEISVLLILGGILYFGLTYLIDFDTRKLVKSIFNEILKR